MKHYTLIVTLLLSTVLILSACTGARDLAAPVISDISTSGKVVVISDCSATSVNITAKVTDASIIKNVQLWYRVGSEVQFASTKMNLQNGLYASVVKGSDLQGQGYGAMEFYITAMDESGNTGKSPLDHSIQFLPCVSN